jgi:glycosyltransferase involved in cell wall biosynthesis
MKEKVSIIVPVYNERQNLEPFMTSLTHALEPTGEEYEVLLIDDGSTDGSHAYLDTLPEKNARVRVIQFRRNFGQTAAMAAGFDYASGSILIPMDADLQNDPLDIPAILALWRDAPVYPHLCILGRGASGGDSRKASRSLFRFQQIWTQSHLQGYSRSNYCENAGQLFHKAYVFLRRRGFNGLCGRFCIRFADSVR